MKKVAVQGIKGSFHENAARRYFNEKIEIEECRSFTRVCQLADSDQVDFAVMAIENSIAGSLLNNYALMRDYYLRIIGEIYVHIQMNLMVLPGVKFDQIEEIHPHPIALKQCIEYIEEKFGEIMLKEKSDTAGTPKGLIDEQVMKAAAIGNMRSAEIYGLELLDRAIETNKKITPGFWCLPKKLICREKGIKHPSVLK